MSAYTNDMPVAYGKNNNVLINNYNHCVHRSTRCEEQPMWENCGDLPRHNIKLILLSSVLQLDVHFIKHACLYLNHKYICF